MAEKKTVDPDVVVLFKMGDKIVNGSGSVLKGMTPSLGKGALGYLKLGN